MNTLPKSIATRLCIGMIVLTASAAVGGNSLGQLQRQPAADTEQETAPTVVRALEDPALIQTEDEPLVAVLGNGQSIRIAPHSTLFLEEIGGGVVQASVRRGTVSLRDARGALRSAGKNSLFQLGPAPLLPPAVASEAPPEAAADESARSARRARR